MCKSYPKTRVSIKSPKLSSAVTNISYIGRLLATVSKSMARRVEFDLRVHIAIVHKKLEKEYREGAKMAVHSSIEAMRKMVTAGELD